MRTTESTSKAYTALERIAWLSSNNPNQEFFSLMHHYSVGSLRDCFQKLDGRKAVGTDGVDKQTYGENLQGNLENLMRRMKSMSYRPQPVRQVEIPKEGKAGSFRPLGISNFEDKLVQKRTQEILESVYDPIFLNCSYGFRPHRGCHDAIKELSTYIYNNEVEVILDIDLANYFGTIDHKLLEQLLRMKIKDTKFMRYIIRMFKAGVLAKNELTVGEEGVPQGSCCSPVFANIFAHYVIDEWFENTVKKHCEKQVEMFRYADDIVICCNKARDAYRIKKALSKRLSRYKLKLNEEKTKLVNFSKSKFRRGERQGTFGFLGFTFYLAKSRKGLCVPKVSTDRKRIRSKLKKVSEWARKVRNRASMRDIWKMFCMKLQGHIRYYGVSNNSKKVRNFIHEATVILFKWLNRRSQRNSITWESFNAFSKMFPTPKVTVYHALY